MLIRTLKRKAGLSIIPSRHHPCVGSFWMPLSCKPSCLSSSSTSTFYVDLCLSPGKTPCHPHIPTFESLLLVLVKSGNGFFIFFCTVWVIFTTLFSRLLIYSSYHLIYSLFLLVHFYFSYCISQLSLICLSIFSLWNFSLYSSKLLSSLSIFVVIFWLFPGGSDDKKICLQCRRWGFNPWVVKIFWRRE